MVEHKLAGLTKQYTYNQALRTDSKIASHPTEDAIDDTVAFNSCCYLHSVVVFFYF